MYEIMLFVHIAGALLLFGAIAIELLCAVNMLRAQRMEHLRLWSQAMTVTEKMFPIATVVLIGAGTYLALTRFSFREPFVVVALTGLLLIGVQSNLLQVKAWRSVHADTKDAPDGPIPAELAARIARPSVWAGFLGDSAAALAAVILITNKPGRIASIAILVILSAAGAALGPFVVRGRQTPVPAAPVKLA